MLIRLLKAFDFQPKLALVSRTIEKAASHLAHFGLLFGFVLTGFSACAFVTFGRISSSFSDMGSAMKTCFNVFLGEIDIDEEMSASDYEIGWLVFYFSFLMVSFFLLLNVLLAIVVDAYVEVKDDASGSRGVFEEIVTIVRFAMPCSRSNHDLAYIKEILLRVAGQNKPCPALQRQCSACCRYRDQKKVSAKIEPTGVAAVRTVGASSDQLVDKRVPRIALSSDAGFGRTSTFHVRRSFLGQLLDGHTSIEGESSKKRLDTSEIVGRLFDLFGESLSEEEIMQTDMEEIVEARQLQHKIMNYFAAHGRASTPREKQPSV